MGSAEAAIQDVGLRGRNAGLGGGEPVLAKCPQPAKACMVTSALLGAEHAPASPQGPPGPGLHGFIIIITLQFASVTHYSKLLVIQVKVQKGQSNIYLVNKASCYILQIHVDALVQLA